MSGVAVVLVLSAAWYSFREPHHEGRPLSAWVQDLKSNEPGVRERAISALHAMSPEALPELAEDVRRRPGAIHRMLDSFRRQMPEWAKRPLRRFYDPSARVMRRYDAAQALRVMGVDGQQAIPALGQMLHDPNVLLSDAAAGALGRMGSNAVPVLIDALNKGSFNVRMNACKALAEIGPDAAAAIPTLCAMLETEREPLVSSASYALSRTGDSALEPLRNLLTHTNESTRHWAAYALTFTTATNLNHVRPTMATPRVP